MGPAQASYLVGDTASRFPTSLKYLHLGGLAASDNLFTITPSAPASAATGSGKKSSEPILKSHLRDLVALRLDNCPRLTVNGLFGCVRQKNMPNLLRLHAYWLYSEESYNDVELWKTFAASEDIKVDTEVEGLVWLTALKEVAPGAVQQQDPRLNMPTPPQPAHMAHGGGARYLMPPGAAPVLQAGSSASASSKHRKKKHSRSRRGRRRRASDSDSSEEDSSDESSSSEEASDSDDSGYTDYHSSRSRRSRSPAGRSASSSHRRRKKRH